MSSKEGTYHYKGFYQVKSIQKFYSIIEDSEEIINNAHEIRNNSPLSHASAELLDGKDSYEKIENSIKSLKELIIKYINNMR